MKKPICKNRTVNKKTDGSRSFDKWLFGENTFCLLIYVYSVISLIQSLFIKDAQKITRCNLTEISIVVVLWLLLVNRVNCAAFNGFLSVFNRYAPTVTVVTYLLFFLAEHINFEYIKPCHDLEQYQPIIKIVTVIVLVLSAIAFFVFVYRKHKKSKAK